MKRERENRHQTIWEKDSQLSLVSCVPTIAMVGHSLNFDWSILSTLLTSSSPIPGDIKFKVVDKEDGLVTTLDAHKIILALHSDHFKNVFYGPEFKFKEEEEGIMVIKETTRAAFEDIIGFYYEKNIEFEKNTSKELYVPEHIEQNIYFKHSAYFGQIICFSRKFIYSWYDG